jgi:hypothetical protein
MFLPHTKRHFFVVNYQVRRVFRLVVVILRCRWVWRFGGIILTGENQNTRRKIYSSSGLPTTTHVDCPPWTRATTLRGWQRNTSAMESSLKTDVCLNCILEIQLYMTASFSIRNTGRLMLFMEIISTDYKQREKHINNSAKKCWVTSHYSGWCM